MENQVILVIMCVFALIIILTLMDFNASLNHGLDTSVYKNAGYAAADRVFSSLALFGSIIGIVIGCSAISSERQSNALTTLLVKPVYRHTIINGKFIGAAFFIAMVMGFATIFFTAGVLIMCGNSIAPAIDDYISRLMIGFVVSLLYVSVFLSGAMAISLVIRNQAFAMILGIILIFIFVTIPNAGFALNLSKVFSNNGLNQQIMDISPWFTLFRTHEIIFNDLYTPLTALIMVLPLIYTFVTYAVIAFLLSYIIFTRTDVS